MGKTDDSDFLQAFYSVYKKIRTIFFPYLLSTCKNKDATVLPSVKNI